MWKWLNVQRVGVHGEDLENDGDVVFIVGRPCVVLRVSVFIITHGYSLTALDYKSNTDLFYSS